LFLDEKTNIKILNKWLKETLIAYFL
jgi:hypothetical protein